MQKNTKRGHLIKFDHVLRNRTGTENVCFIARTIGDWNSSPNCVFEKHSVEAFKMADICHL